MDMSVLFFIASFPSSGNVATLFVVIAGIGIAYLLAMKKFPGKELLDTLFTLPLVLPPTVIGYYLIVLFGRNGLLGHISYSGPVSASCLPGTRRCLLPLWWRCR